MNTEKITRLQDRLRRAAYILETATGEFYFGLPHDEAEKVFQTGKEANQALIMLFAGKATLKKAEAAIEALDTLRAVILDIEVYDVFEGIVEGAAWAALRLTQDIRDEVTTA